MGFIVLVEKNGDVLVERHGEKKRKETRRKKEEKKDILNCEIWVKMLGYKGNDKIVILKWMCN